MPCQFYLQNTLSKFPKSLLTWVLGCLLKISPVITGHLTKISTFKHLSLPILCCYKGRRREGCVQRSRGKTESKRKRGGRYQALFNHQILWELTEWKLTPKKGINLLVKDPLWPKHLPLCPIFNIGDPVSTLDLEKTNIQTIATLLSNLLPAFYF